MSNAAIHAKIAANVYPDAKKIEINNVHNSCYVIFGDRNRDMQPWFDLLETDSNGNPTQQAKASALDVYIWMCKQGGTAQIYIYKYANPCAAIYEAAKEIVNNDS
ncbi:MAG: hypothetical protein KAR40_11060 [Candidatus Sabulitectum sp.]|nr:hypothetical protein [Candidatus Sabulitectum sp.]